jgi:hypothetical protein
MDSYDQYDVLNTALVDAKQYPNNLIRSQSFKHDLLEYNEELRRQESRLFLDHPEYSGVRLIESYDGGGEYSDDADIKKHSSLWRLLMNCEYLDFGPSKRYRTAEELRGHFQAERKDPRCRHV